MSIAQNSDLSEPGFIVAEDGLRLALDQISPIDGAPTVLLVRGEAKSSATARSKRSTP